jgi:hypothetical protein
VVSSKINAEWHRAHPMPPRATMDQRVDWHLAHLKACRCRRVPEGIVKELERRGISPRASEAL